MDKNFLRKVIDTYGLDEILELNDMEITDLLLEAYLSGLIKLPEELPTDVEDT